MTRWAIESAPMPEWARQAGLTGCHLYRGHSMGRTFREADRLYFRQVPLALLGSGDVVIFAEETIRIVHRVVRQGQPGTITKGDACRSVDRAPLTPENYLGRVEWVVRGRRKFRVRSRLGGRIQHCLAQYRARVLGLMKTLAAPIYRPLRNSRKVNRLLLRISNPHLKLAAFYSPEGVVLKVIYKHRSIARLHPGMIWARVKRPYDLWLGLGGEMAHFLKYRETLEGDLEAARRELEIYRRGIK